MSKVKKKQKPAVSNQKPQEKSRKLLRKEKRLEKKHRRVEYQAKQAQLRKGVIPLSDSAKPKVNAPPKAVSGNNIGKNASKHPDPQEPTSIIEKERKEKAKLESEMAKQRKAQLLAANKAEDREIKRLEKLLKLDKRKKKNIPKSFYADNLGSVLEVCDQDYLKKLAETEKTIQDSGSEFEEDFAAATGRQVVSKKKKKKDKIGSTGEESASDDDSNLDFSDGDLSDEDLPDEDLSDEDLPDEDLSDEDTAPLRKSQDSSKPQSSRKLKSKSTGSNDIDEDDDFSDVSDLNSEESDFGLGVDDGTGSEEEDMSGLSEEDDLDDSEDDELSGGESADNHEEKMEKGNRKKVHFLDDCTDNKKSKKVKNKKDATFDDDAFSGDESDDNHKVEKMDKGNRKRVHSSEDLTENKKSKKEKIDSKSSSKEKGSTDKKSKKDEAFDDDDDDEFSEDESVDGDEEKLGKGNRKSVHFSDDPTENIKSKKVKNDSKGNGKADIVKNKEDETFDDDDDWDDDDFGDDSDGEDDKPKGAVKKNPDGTWEDIYGRLRNSAGDVVEEKPTKYVPPHLRAQTSDSKKKELERLRRQMKGLMNRLAENNMASISAQLDEMYMTNSRYDMNDTLTTLTLEALVAPVLTPDRLVMEHSLLIALLHANVGSEVGAHFLQNVVQRFDQNLGKDVEVEDKTLDNIVHIVSHLYNFKIFSAPLIFSILDKIAETLNEKRIDLLLLILRTVGSTLRKVDPIALKNLILRLQAKAAGTPALQESSRVKFLLEVLLAIKNNNMNKIPNYNPETIEHAKKLLRTLIRRGKYVTELNITLEDLLKADERGRWWIVGSAWTGHLPGESDSTEKGDRLKKAERKSDGEYNVELLELARKQRMNTDTRRNIFCILLTAEDYLDAFEKLLHLNLTNQQDQEIIHVLLHCTLQEKTFNPYYAHLAQKFCDFDRKYQMKLQYAVWDKLKELSSLQSFQISNLARLLAHLFLEKGLPISVLKVVSFAEIDKTSVRLIRQILLGVLMAEDRNESEAVFLRVAPSPKLRLFREGLRLFIRHFMLRQNNAKFLSEEELALLEERAVMAEKALSAAENELQF